MADQGHIYDGFVDPVVLAEQEQFVIDSMEISSNASEVIEATYSLNPERMKGMRVVDIAAGGSDLTARFCELGADAVAIDPSYDDRDIFVARSSDFIGFLDEIDEVERTARRQSMPPNVIIVDRPSDKNDNPRVTNRSANARFLEDWAAHPERYITGSAIDLPLPDRSADLVLNLNFLSNLHEVLPEFALATVWEGIRILRKSGSMKIGLFKETQDEKALFQYHDTDKLEVVADAVERIKQAGIKVSMARRMLTSEVQFLEITRKK